MKRVLGFLFSVVSYLMFLGVFVYMIGFIGNFVVPTTLDGPAETTFVAALTMNLLLLILFGAQHSLMARQSAKRLLTRWVPQALERSVYVLATCIALAIVFWQWQPMGGVVWAVDNAVARGALYTLFAAGWLTVLVTTFLINHFDLFGLRQGWLYLRRKPYQPLPFVTPGPYRLVRHPLYVGWLLAFWATPTMTTAHLVYALGMTAYILVAIRYEEHDLVNHHGAAYESYRRQVPMLLPRLNGRKRLVEIGTKAGSSNGDAPVSTLRAASVRE